VQSNSTLALSSRAARVLRSRWKKRPVARIETTAKAAAAL
jgi:hypothetical protein